jgi:pimeloyl-ACP methyl ester carboxylesterase
MAYDRIIIEFNLYKKRSVKQLKPMNKKTIKFSLISLCILFANLLTSNSGELITDFYDVNFLRNSTVVEKILKRRGFFEVNFKTQDNLTINAIMLDQRKTRNVTATIISFPGFFPGDKEGMSTLYAMLENQPYNFIFIDSRGHGKSEGQLLTFQGIKHYGEKEYLDMIATIQFIVQYNKQHNISENIIIHGLCAGAFHTAKAVADLKNSDPKTYNCIKGIILDSAWPAIVDIVDTLVEAESRERCKSYGVPYLQPYLAYIMRGVYNTFFKYWHRKQTPLNEAISEIDQPIFFIHAEQDDYVPLHNVYPLIKVAKNPSTWFVKDSSHVNNHLQHKEKYTDQMQDFIQSVL